jgi:signal transduction histidine kinase
VIEHLPKILIVDDEPSNHRVYERTLESLNLEFVHVLSGPKALAMAHKHTFFLILMDVQMPGMDGFEAATLILDHPKTNHIPIIFITAYARDEVFEFKGYASGAVDYLVKPINDDIVLGKVKVFLDLHKDKNNLNEECQFRKKIEKELRVDKSQLEDIVSKRSVELQNSIQNLVQAQTQLVESEKMASLGRLVAGVAHELNTPIGVCITASSFLHETMDRLITAYQNGQMKKNDLESFISKAPQSTQIILSNLNRASELITNFKLVAVDVSSDMVRQFNLHEYISKVVHSLHPETRQGNHDISIEGHPSLMVETYPGTISQIITNLVMNSLIHGFNEEKNGNIIIKLSCFEDKIALNYSDNGSGMNEEVKSKIFEPFYTTRRGSGGSGLGMFILHNLVTQTLSGEISCQSKEGEGTDFNISFPKKMLLNTKNEVH